MLQFFVVLFLPEASRFSAQDSTVRCPGRREPRQGSSLYPFARGSLHPTDIDTPIISRTVGNISNILRRTMYARLQDAASYSGAGLFDRA